MTIAPKRTMITAAVAVGVLAAGGIATPTGQATIASAPTKQVSVPTGPDLAALVTPNTLFAAVSGLPTASTGGSSNAAGTAAPVATTLVGNTGAAAPPGPAVASQSSPNLFTPTIFARSAVAPTGGGSPVATGGTTLAAVRTVGGTSASTLAAPAASANLALVPASALNSVAGLIGGVVGIFISNGTEEHPNAGLLIGNGWDATNGQDGGNGGLLFGSGGGVLGSGTGGAGGWGGNAGQVFGNGGDGGAGGAILTPAGTATGGAGGDGGHSSALGQGGNGGAGGDATNCIAGAATGGIESTSNGDNGAHGSRRLGRYPARALSG
jgi:hypothetical protein